MTAATTGRASDSKHLGDIQSFKVAAAAKIYAGTMVMLKSDGYATPAADLAGNQGVVGEALTTVDNTLGGDGDLRVAVQEGSFRVVGTTLAIGSVGSFVYAEDDQTVDETKAGNEPLAGILLQVDSATVGWVYMSWKLTGNAGVKSYGVITIPIADMTIIADADFVTEIIPGFAGTIEKVYWVQGDPVTTGAKLSDLNLEIEAVDVTGGVVALTSATCTPLGKVIEGSAVTANNEFGATEKISVEGSSTTAFAEGAGFLHIVYSQTVAVTVTP